MTNQLDYFASPGAITAVGDLGPLLDPLPTDLPSLRRAVQGLLLHVFWADQYGVRLTPAQRDEVQLRYVVLQLRKIVEHCQRPLTEAREPGSKLVGNCRDFSVMLTAMLRHQGVPARARCGFARYFEADHFEDHWVAECWDRNLGRWTLVDAQLDEMQCRKLGIDFDPLDVPRTQFLVGGKAWTICRQGKADPDKFGIFDMHGMWFIRGNLVRDLAALNKLELLPWDSWGIMESRDEDLTPSDLNLLDQVADFAGSDPPETSSLRRIYESEDRLRVPAAIRSYTQAGVRTVLLSG